MNEAPIQTKLAYTEIIGLHQQLRWEVLGEVQLCEAVEQFLTLLQTHTQRSYRAAINLMFAKGLLDPTMTMQQFALLDLESILDRIRTTIYGAEATKQARAAAFVSLTTFLERRTGGMVKKVRLNRETTGKTFSKIRDKAATQALTQAEWDEFIYHLKERSERDALIAQSLLQGAKRLDEVLSVRIEDVDFAEGTITFTQQKCDRVKQTVIFLSVAYMGALKRYLGNRLDGLVFINRNGGKLNPNQIWLSFKTAGGVHPHQLRATAITWMMSRGFGAESVQKVSGHCNLDAVIYYDKSSLKDNPTRKMSLI